MLAGIGVAFGITALGYDLGTPLSMGPAMFPLVICVVLVAVGAIVVVRAFLAPSQEPEPAAAPDGPVDVVATAFDEGVDAVADVATRPQRFGGIPWRPALLVTAAVVWFALTIDGLGLLLACFGTVLLASFARGGLRWWQPLAVAAALTFASWLIFVVGLRLRVPLLGDWLGG